MRFPKPACREIARSCTLFGVRSAARAVTRLYEESLAPAGLKATQLSILVATASREGWTLSALADALRLERTTLTRNARPLQRKGLLRLGAGRDLRSRSVELTARGHAALRRAYPLWRKTQRRVVARMGKRRWAGLLRDLALLSALAPA